MQQKERDLRYSVRCRDLRASRRRERRDKAPCLRRKRHAVSQGRGDIEAPNRSAAMRKAIHVLALIALACDISREHVLVHGEPARKPEAAGRSDSYDHQRDNSRRQLDDAEMPRRSTEDRVRSSEPVGKWRSNGEALEPKWRDGDSVPLLPFSHYRSYTRDEIDDVEHEDFPETSRRPFKYRYSMDQTIRPRESQARRVPSTDDYDYGVATYRSNDDDPNEDYPRKRRRPLKNPTLYEETSVNAASNGKRGYNVEESLNDKEATSRYREAFQARPNEYEHEFDDEEYLRPRPRKRRPPQNYEFALANEASSNEGDEVSRDSSRPPSQPPKGNENLPVVTQSSDNERRNALELKSLLKMQQKEGSSLSEILQRRNLTLSDLLKGKADVINALKSRITDESDEYIEEMSRVMSNSLMKLAVTVTPLWGPTQTSVPSESTAVKTDSSVFEVTIDPEKVSKSYDEISLNDTNRIKKEDAAQVTQPVHDSPWLRDPTTPPIVSTVITTSTSAPIAMNSMEYLLNDDGNAESASDRATKLESLDEDEIMEFSDFTDFKKGKSPAAPSWMSLPNESVVSQQPSHDVESTLSIEQILNPTERIKPTKDRESDRDDNTENNNNKSIQDNGQLIPIGGPSAEDYNTFIESEYQNDAPIPEYDGEQGNVKDGASASKNDDAAASDHVEKKEIENSADDRKESYDKNHSTEYHQVNRLPGEKIRALENHRGTNGKRYEEVVSEIEPEARAEIFELFASGSAGKRLERLLKSRNMSVEELIALRQRGSSKVHLTEVSRLRTFKPENLQTTEISNANDRRIVIPLSSASESNGPLGESTKISEESKKGETEDSMKQLQRDIMSYLHDPFFDKDAENMSMSKLLDLVERDRNASRGTFAENETPDANEHGELEDPRRTMQIVDLLTTFGSLPFAKDAQRQYEAVVDNNGYKSKTQLLDADNGNTSVVSIDKGKTARSDNSSSEFRAGYVEEIVKEEPNAIDVETIYGETVSGMNDEEERKTLSKVKPSIIASGAILGVTIVVFLAIFIVCRIRQKQRYTYRNTFSRAVFQGPIMAARKLSNSSSLSTVMVNVVATSTTKRPERTEMQETVEEFDGKSDMDNDSLDANDSWETIPDYAK